MAVIPEDLPGQLVAVEWLDSCSPDGWQEIGEYTSKPPLLCWTAGWITHQKEGDDGFLVIAGSVGQDGGDVSCANSPLTIPTFAIRRSWTLAGLPVSKAPMP